MFVGKFLLLVLIIQYNRGDCTQYYESGQWLAYNDLNNTNETTIYDQTICNNISKLLKKQSDLEITEKSIICFKYCYDQKINSGFIEKDETNISSCIITDIVLFPTMIVTSVLITRRTLLRLLTQQPTEITSTV